MNATRAMIGRKPVATACLIVMLSSLTGCTMEKVAPWQRGNLAKRVMVRDATPAQAALDQHAYSAKEATAGGYGIGAGGCGCN